jgi:glutathione S-transferase
MPVDPNAPIRISAFNWVPPFAQGQSGAIVLHIGRDCETLLPAHPAARARATAWLIAALNRVEPYLMQLATIDIFAAG